MLFSYIAVITLMNLSDVANKDGTFTKAFLSDDSDASLNQNCGLEGSDE
jgi:hypothetical protein